MDPNDLFDFKSIELLSKAFRSWSNQDSDGSRARNERDSDKLNNPEVEERKDFIAEHFGTMESVSRKVLPRHGQPEEKERSWWWKFCTALFELYLGELFESHRLSFEGQNKPETVENYHSFKDCFERYDWKFCGLGERP